MIATACKKAKKRGLLRGNFPIFFCHRAKSKVSQEYSITFDHFTQPFEALNGGFLEKRCPWPWQPKAKHSLLIFVRFYTLLLSTTKPELFFISPAATPLMDIVDTPCPGYFVAGECAPCPAATPSIDIVDTSRSCPDSDVAGNCTLRPTLAPNPEDLGTTIYCISVAALTSRDLSDVTTSLPDLVAALPAADVLVHPPPDPLDAAPRPVRRQPLPFRLQDYVLQDIPAAPD